MDVLPVLVLLCAVILLPLPTESAEICRRSFYIDEDIDVYGNDTDLVTLRMDCSQAGFPSLSVTVEPRLRAQIGESRSLNGKVAFSIRCEMNNEVRYMNRSAAVRKSEPWTSNIQFGNSLPLGQNCSFVACYWDSFRYSETLEEQRRYAVHGSSCITNLNECVRNPGLCEHDCTDTIAGYECSCWPGYRLQNDSMSCTDEDECLSGAHACSHNCTNTEGSYLCSCPVGYSLDQDNATCTDIDECLSGENPCNHQCNNTAGSYRCLCRQGFKLSDDQHSCEDINECDPESSVNHQCQHSCNNTIGSYFCSCDNSYTLSSDRHRCLAMGECESPRVCVHICVNTSGDYFCQCHSGYRLSQDGHNCTAKGTLGDGVLVIYMPWAVPLACASLLLLLALTLYYAITRRRKQGHILETNQDLYEFYLTQEKIDCSYQPVDLSNGLPFDTESIHSEMTSFHSTSNTNEDLAKLAASEQTKLVLVTYDPSAISNSKDNIAAGAGEGEAGSGSGCEGREQSEEKERKNSETCDDFEEEFGNGLGKVSSQDSCIGSSIAGDTSSGFRASTIFCTPDTSGSSFACSTDTSANSDYIATDCESSPSSTLSQQNSPPGFSANPLVNHSSSDVQSLNKEGENSCLDGASPASKGGSAGKERKGFSKTKDYIHATNALFAVVDRTPSNTE